jgi:lipoprotein signal peptidase
MTTLIVALFLVLLIDQLLKLLLWRRLRSQAVPLCRLRDVGVIPAQLWLAHVARCSSPVMTWIMWALLAVTLVVVSTWLPLSRIFVGVLLGGSVSNALESSLRGIVTDYVYFRFWPAFNMADAAITAGAIGLLAQVVILAENIIVR